MQLEMTKFNLCFLCWEVNAELLKDSKSLKKKLYLLKYLY